MTRDKIIELQKIKKSRQTIDTCTCGPKAKYLINEDYGTVSCETCGNRVEPFYALLNMANKSDAWTRSYERITEAVKAKRKEYEMLTKKPPFRVVVKKIERKFFGNNKLYPKCPCCGEHFDFSEVLDNGANNHVIESKIKRRIGLEEEQ